MLARQYDEMLIGHALSSLWEDGFVLSAVTASREHGTSGRFSCAVARNEPESSLGQALLPNTQHAPIVKAMIAAVCDGNDPLSCQCDVSSDIR